MVFPFSINCILSIESDVIAMLTPEAKNDQAPVTDNFLPLKVSADLTVRPHLFKLNNSNLNNISMLKPALTLITKSWSSHSLSYLEIDCLNVTLSHYFLWETWASPHYWMDFWQNSLKILTTDFSHFVLTRSQDTSSICNLCIFYVWGKNSIFLFTIIFLILHYLSQNFISVSRQKKCFFG